MSPDTVRLCENDEVCVDNENLDQFPNEMLSKYMTVMVALSIFLQLQLQNAEKT